MNIKKLVPQLRESSTWRGLVMLSAALGIVLSPEQQDAIVAAGMALSGIIGVFFSDKE